MYVCMYVCIYVCMYVCMYVMYVCMYVMYVCMYICMYVCMYVCIYVCMYVCIYVCMYLCMYVCSLTLLLQLQKHTCIHNAYGIRYDFLLRTLQFGSECYCGKGKHNKFGRRPDHECGMVCPGNHTQHCGGGGRISVYHLCKTVLLIHVLCISLMTYFHKKIKFNIFIKSMHGIRNLIYY